MNERPTTRRGSVGPTVGAGDIPSIAPFFDRYVKFESPREATKFPCPSLRRFFQS
jgi:hypothetical protein